MTQTIYPTADVSVGGWSNPTWSVVDDDSDADYSQAETRSGNQVVECHAGALSDPASASDHVITVPNAIHDWGLYRDSNGAIYVAVGRQLDASGMSLGAGIYRSGDDGSTWTLDGASALGAYRTYDVLAVRRGMAAIASDDYYSDCHLAVKLAEQDWRRVAAPVVCRTRLARDLTGRHILALLANGTGIYEPLAGRRIFFDGFRVEPWAYNWLATSASEYYVVTNDGRVMRSTDLLHWTMLADFGQPVLTVAYWPAQQALAVAERGAGGGLWLLRLAP